MSDLPELAEGTLLPDANGRSFTLLEQLGRGGFSEVYLARVEQSDGLVRRVALKLLHPGLDPEGQPVERMRDEAKLLAKLEHPAILSASELVEVGGRVAMVMEYVAGVDFKDCLENEMPKGPILEVIEQVAEALHVAWTEHNVVHRDIKPANIRVGSSGNVKLIDFGIARYEGMTRSAQTTSGTLLGTLTYLAPERFDLNVGTPEPASDIFALGCVMFEAWTGARFFGGLEASKLLRLTEDAEQFDTYLDERLTETSLDPIGPLLADMLSFHPDERPTALEVAQRCEQLAARWPGRLTLRRWCRERRWPDPGGTREESPPPVLTSQVLSMASMLPSALDAPTVPVETMDDTDQTQLRSQATTPSHDVFPPLPLPRTALVGGSVVAAGAMAITLALIAGLPWRSRPIEEARVAATEVVAEPSLRPVTEPFEKRAEPVEVERPARKPRSRRSRQADPAPPNKAPNKPAATAAPAPDPAGPKYSLLVTSVPNGAEIELAGKFQNYTPHTLELASGSYTLSLSIDERRIERSIKVGPFARGFVWCVEKGSWKSTSSTDWAEAGRVCDE